MNVKKISPGQLSQVVSAAQQRGPFQLNLIVMLIYLYSQTASCRLPNVVRYLSSSSMRTTLK